MGPELTIIDILVNGRKLRQDKGRKKSGLARRCVPGHDNGTLAEQLVKNNGRLIPALYGDTFEIQVGRELRYPEHIPLIIEIAGDDPHKVPVLKTQLAVDMVLKPHEHTLHVTLDALEYVRFIGKSAVIVNGNDPFPAVHIQHGLTRPQHKLVIVVPFETIVRQIRKKDIHKKMGKVEKILEYLHIADDGLRTVVHYFRLDGNLFYKMGVAQRVDRLNGSLRDVEPPGDFVIHEDAPHIHIARV